MAEVLFFFAATGAIAGAYCVIRDWNPFYNVLALVVHLICLAALFLLLRAEFVAAAQVVVYAGAVMVLYVFVVAYVGGSAEPMRRPFAPGLRGLAVLFAVALVVELWIALLGTGLKGVETEGAAFDPEFGTPRRLGEALLTKFLLPFELASLLLLVAAVGAVVLARRRRGAGIEDPDEVGTLSVVDALRPEGTGTMKEAVSGIPDVGGEPAGTHPKGTDPTRPEIGAGRTDQWEGGW
ncbi:MAG TPA: NADH-quinone oxidoreductase subunit J [Solirubrobacteraceae bacterium]|nr:NADH-quinone oxidoreductase subunit J [Solirubrobacteraceae bacterium]